MKVYSNHAHIVMVAVMLKMNSDLGTCLLKILKHSDLVFCVLTIRLSYKQEQLINAALESVACLLLTSLLFSFMDFLQ